MLRDTMDTDDGSDRPLAVFSNTSSTRQSSTVVVVVVDLQPHLYLATSSHLVIWRLSIICACARRSVFEKMICEQGEHCECVRVFHHASTSTGSSRDYRLVQEVGPRARTGRAV